jgi:hypothetical protein
LRFCSAVSRRQGAAESKVRDNKELSELEASINEHCHWVENRKSQA